MSSLLPNSISDAVLKQSEFNTENKIVVKG